MTRNRYIFESVIDGFVNVYEDSGKFNNRSFSFTIPDEVLGQCETDREELLEWAKSKAPNPKRCEVALPKWDETGLVKYAYGGETKRPEPVFVDTTGAPVERSVLKDLRRGTKVKLIVQQGPYIFGQKVGTKFRVVGVQIIELATGNGSVDSGDMSVEDVASLFGTTDGFKQDEPQVRKAETVGDGETYDF